MEKEKIFYLSAGDLWRWEMNISRAMGNIRNFMDTDDRIQEFTENRDERVRAVYVWGQGPNAGNWQNEPWNDFCGIARVSVAKTRRLL